jgi:hypothetical protein
MFWDIYTPYRTRVQGMPEPDQVLIPEDMHSKAWRFYIEQG